MTDALKQNYGYLFEDSLLEEISRIGTLKKVPEGFQLMDIGEPIKGMPLILDGAIKILREDEKGNELLLYFIERGDTCAMTLSCCVGRAKSEIRAVAETDTTLVMIPVEKMESWMAAYKSWRQFILQSYHDRLMEMLDTIDSIAFLKMDERLLRHLRDKAMITHDDVIQTTHQEIAQDLNTSRVVVSRLLKKLENQGKIQLHRNSIKVIVL
ncbi:Crp/Fnr family transcriptional regulator [Sinomicrobium weinanense]|uniref:Crp/Fnr family transcriptional regulator n=1 Tax=Sinomicrobium weinanense TaxID=2842200 RepID=A0A926JQC8_9FLAO|nr:Crp/Fnr family transcriptional regulator [Sinomicrobium weinanense]MBC9795439.1 Crp/Fnr family transcriptional regulator [Sinomicrobium weinanense]MBU3123964.1 Crp/Fnr family transcriptional regulator [Sinomicrobium weinanense]